MEWFTLAVSLLIRSPVEAVIPTFPLDPVNEISVSYDNKAYLAPENGEVAKTGKSYGLRFVDFLGDSGMEYVFSGLSDYYAKKGDRVSKGDPLGVDQTLSIHTKIIYIEHDKIPEFPQFAGDYISFVFQTGHSVYAVADSKVTDAGFDGNNGNFLTLHASDSIDVTYAHLDKYCVKQDQQVKHGDMIGALGNTGKSYRSHLCLLISTDPSTCVSYKAIFIKRL